jgi:hypothetical protein
MVSGMSTTVAFCAVAHLRGNTTLIIEAKKGAEKKCVAPNHLNRRIGILKLRT